MKKLVFSLILFFSFSFASPALAASSEYTIESFESKITVNQDASLTIEETILANFHVRKHGIFRIIPIIYSATGKTIKADFKLLSITDEQGNSYPYTTPRLSQSVKLKIGDPNKTITGLNTYLIKYQIKDVLLRHKDHDEIYWNVTGSEWDTTIKKASATVSSSFAQITKVSCFAGPVGKQDKNCEADFEGSEAHFSAAIPLSWGKDLTLVVGLDKENQLIFPGLIKRITSLLLNNWGYLLALAPIGFLFYFWFKKGRDLRFVSDNVFYQPESEKTRTVSLFAREHLPSVYSPIDGLTPAEVGTILDERVDIHDVVAEIVELARLGHLEIKKIEKKKLIRKKIDYWFIKKEKNITGLKSYQKYLLEKIFASNGKQKVSLSALKNKFYLHLETFKKKLYEHLAKEKIFAGNPAKIRLKWTGIFAVLIIVAFIGSVFFAIMTANSGPILLIIISIFPAIFIIKNMPRRTAWGHSLFRQSIGLRYYVNKGKWREEIAEKHLFLEEILPLAICLGVVKKLARDMAVLKVAPPAYFAGVTTTHLYSDLNHFSTRAASSLVSSPESQWSGKSSWSGGSGFSSGGSSGGGFGGGGGGSW